MRIRVKGDEKNIILSTRSAIELVNLCYEPWKNDYDVALHRWETEKLPELLEKIDEHNKDVENKKSVYSFNTYLPISETEKEVIIQKQKDFFIYTNQQVYEFRSSFEVQTKHKTYTDTTPEFFEDVDWTKVQSAEFECESKDKKKIQINISLNSLFENGLKYTIEGEEAWVNIKKAEIENVLDESKKPIKLTKYKFFISSLLSIGTSYLLYVWLLAKLLAGINLQIDTKYVLLALFFLSILLFPQYRKHLEKNLPSVAITDNYDPYNKGLLAWVIIIIVGVIQDILTDIIS